MKRLDSKIGWLGCLLAVFLLGSVDMMAQPANDDCDGTVTVTDITADGTVYSVSGDGTGATDGLNAGAAHVWEAFTLTECATVSIAFCNSENPPTNVFISVTDCPVTGATNGVTETCNVEDFIVIWDLLTPGTYYYPVMADPNFGGNAPYTIEISAVAASCITNDDACDAIEVIVDAPAVTLDNTGATPDGPAGDCWFGGDETQNDIWVTFVAPGSGAVSMQTFDIGGNNDTQFGVFSSSDGTCTGELTSIGCNDDEAGSLMSYLELFDLTPGDTYWVQIDGYNGTPGEFDMVINSISLIDECPNPGAIICDNFDEYELAMIAGQASHWVDWPGGSTSSMVSTEQAFSNAQSLNVAPGGAEDQLLLLGDRTDGLWTVDFMMYVPAGANGYYNMQNTEATGQWNFDIFFNTGGAGDYQENQVSVSTFTFPEDQWFAMSHTVDLDNGTVSVSLDGTEIHSGPYIGDMVGCINFYSIDATNNYFIDDVIFDGSGSTVPCPAPDAVICDNVDDYELAMIAGQAAHWADWPGGTTSSMVSTAQSFSNDQSVHVAPGGVEDNLFLLGDQTAGVWTVDFMMYIPAGANGYYNMQNTEATGQWNYDIFFNTGGAGDYQENQVSVSTFTFPEDQWFAMSQTVDLDNGTVSVSLDGTEIHSGPYIGDMVGCINFYSIDATNDYYLDDLIFDGGAGASGTDCASAIDVSAGGTFSSPELSGDLEGFAGSCWTGPNLTAGDWYSYTATADGVLTVTSVDIGGTDTEVAVATGDCGALTEIACSEDFTGDPPWESEVTFDVITGETYYIIWANGWNGDAFDFQVNFGSGVDPCPDPLAIICDNFDDYELAMIAGQAPHWVDWPGGSTSSMVSTEQAFSNTQSLNVAPGGAEDQLLLLGDQSTGVWTVDFMMYVPAGANGYYNLQNTEATGQWNFDIFFNTGGAGDYQENQVSVSTFTFPEDQWFEMSHTVDLNNLTVVVELDGAEIHSGPYIGDMVGSVNFYSIDATNNYFIDDVIVNGNPDVGVIEYSEGAFTIYPNPTENVLTITGDQQIDAVVIRDVLGAVVRQLNTPFSNQVTLDVADLTNGVYFVEVRVGDVVNVSRVIKQ